VSQQLRLHLGSFGVEDCNGTSVSTGRHQVASGVERERVHGRRQHLPVRHHRSREAMLFAEIPQRQMSAAGRRQDASIKPERNGCQWGARGDQ